MDSSIGVYDFMKDLLSEFDDFLRNVGNDGLTSREIAESRGVCQNTVLRWLKKKIAAGEAECCGVKKQFGISGQPKLIPAYRLIKPSPSKAPKKKGRAVSRRSSSRS
jgi:hypothetical protein